MSIEDAKPCPKCGRNPILKKTKTGNELFPVRYEIVCPMCGTRFGLTTAFYQNAVIFWNKLQYKNEKIVYG